MSRTKVWKAKMDELSQREKTILSELEFKTEKLEKRSLIVLAAAGVAAIGIIGFFSLKKKKKSKSKEVVTKVVSKKSGFKIGSFLTEKLIMAAITIIINKFQKEALASEPETDKKDN